MCLCVCAHTPVSTGSPSVTSMQYSLNRSQSVRYSEVSTHTHLGRYLCAWRDSRTWNSGSSLDDFEEDQHTHPYWTSLHTWRRAGLLGKTSPASCTCPVEYSLMWMHAVRSALNGNRVCPYLLTCWKAQDKVPVRTRLETLDFVPDIFCSPFTCFVVVFQNYQLHFPLLDTRVATPP